MQRLYPILGGCLCALIVVMTTIGFARSHHWWSRPATSQANGIPPGTLSRPDGTHVLKISPAEANFGEVIKGTQLTKQFKITNISDNKVSLSVQAFCGCTAVVLGAAELGPGASTAMEVKLSTEGKRGSFAEFVHVYTTGSKNGESYSVKVYGQAMQIVEATPPTLAFGEIRHKRDAVRDVELRTLNGKSLKVKEVTVSANSVVVKPLPVSSPDRATFRVSLPPNAKPGQIFDWIKVSLSSPVEMTETISVTGVYTGDLSATPPRLFFDQLTDENWRDVVLEAKIQSLPAVGGQAGKLFALRRVECKDSRFQTSFEPAGRSDSFLLKIKLAQSIAETFTQTWVTVEGDSSATPATAGRTDLRSEDAMLEIPVSVAKRK